MKILKISILILSLLNLFVSEIFSTDKKKIKEKERGNPPYEINPKEVSGKKTDQDGFLHSFYGDKPPRPIIDFDIGHYFPEAARKKGIRNARVTVAVQIDEQGIMISTKIQHITAEGKGFGFEEAALEILRKAKWEPGTKDGKPIKMNHSVPIVFSWKDPEPTP